MTLFQNYILLIAWLCLFPVCMKLSERRQPKPISEDARAVGGIVELIVYIAVIVSILRARPM